MINLSPDLDTDQTNSPTIWGLSPTELHDRFWAARGVQVVRPGEESEIVEDAELFLLMAPRLITVFRLRLLVDQLSWLKPDVLWVRIINNTERGYRETAVTDAGGRFLRFERTYGGSDARLARVALTPNRDLARRWQAASDAQSGWRQLRAGIPPTRRFARSIAGRTYDRHDDHQVVQFVRHLVQTWTRPDATIDRAQKLATGVWGDSGSRIGAGTDYVGPSWIGAGRELEAGISLVGPAVLWDDPAARPNVQTVRWQELEPTQIFVPPVRPRPPSAFYTRAKRCFDIMFSVFALILVLPFFPIFMLLILVEDGRPFFFVHRRETTGGRVFPCLKFRSMHKNADQIKLSIGDQNEVDGPQFFIEEDPRLTHMGRFMRKCHIDELPQFFNVLAGHMSVVGPRPSPYEENQFCPTWREARLSVLPGITGLWQVKRTRQQGLDFQEWIKYDIEYVEKASLALDLWIVWKTLCRLVGR